MADLTDWCLFTNFWASLTYDWHGPTSLLATSVASLTQQTLNSATLWGVSPAQTHYTKPGLTCTTAGQYTYLVTLLSPATNMDPRTLQYIWYRRERGRVELFVLDNFFWLFLKHSATGSHSEWRFYAPPIEDKQNASSLGMIHMETKQCELMMHPAGYERHPVSHGLHSKSWRQAI